MRVRWLSWTNCWSISRWVFINFTDVVIANTNWRKYDNFKTFQTLHILLSPDAFFFSAGLQDYTHPNVWLQGEQTQQIYRCLSTACVYDPTYPSLLAEKWPGLWSKTGAKEQSVLPIPKDFLTNHKGFIEAEAASPVLVDAFLAFKKGWDEFRLGNQKIPQTSDCWSFSSFQRFPHILGHQMSCDYRIYKLPTFTQIQMRLDPRTTFGVWKTQHRFPRQARIKCWIQLNIVLECHTHPFAKNLVISYHVLSV